MDSFLVECTPEEAAERVLPLVKGLDRRSPSPVGGEYFDFYDQPVEGSTGRVPGTC